MAQAQTGRRCVIEVGLLAMLVTVGACRRPQQPHPLASLAATPTTSRPATPTPPSIAQIIAPLPPVEPMDTHRVALGRHLFHDTRLSRDNSISCSSCHPIDGGGAENEPVSTGIGGQRGSVNSPTVFNARFNIAQFWDGRASDLRTQAAGPVTNPAEMGNDWDNVVATLQGVPAYDTAFGRIYPDGITARNVEDAIATYEMTLVTPSRVDRFLRGDVHALTTEEREGANLFASVGCGSCHNGVNVGGGMFQRMGLVRDYFAERGTPTNEADNGRFNVTHQESDRHVFKVPTLRNVALTAPYFHDGHTPTLEEAVRTMGRDQLGRTLDDTQVSRILLFLNALTGDVPPGARMPPPRVALATPTM